MLRPGATQRVTRSQARQAQAISLSNLLERRSVVPKKPEVPPSPLPDIDGEDRANPLYETAYVNDIYSYYRRIEPKFKIQPGYMTSQVRAAPSAAPPAARARRPPLTRAPPPSAGGHQRQDARHPHRLARGGAPQVQGVGPPRRRAAGRRDRRRPRGECHPQPAGPR